MSNNQRNVVKEDAPVMRSVQILSQAPSMQAPPIPFGRVSVAPSKTAIAPKVQLGESVSVVDKAWKVSQLRPVPSFYRLERTHLKIDDASAGEIATRIADCLRQESVHATFNEDEAMVEAETHDAVSFTTRLFAGEGKVIVELQRQAGCCYMFHQTARTVLRAAKGMEQVKRRTFSVPPSIPKCDAEEEKECLENGLELAGSLLKKDRLDAHMLAMESLTHLSRSAKSQCLVAKTILTGPLLETIVSLVECWSICATDGAEEEKGEVEEHHCATMHRLAISVLANCLSVLEAEGELCSVLAQRREQLCASSLMMALVEELRRAEQRPHDACEAARCLQTLVRSCKCKRSIMECDGLNAAAFAHVTGASSHSNLEKECHLLQMEITNCN